MQQKESCINYHKFGLNESAGACNEDSRLCCEKVLCEFWSIFGLLENSSLLTKIEKKNPSQNLSIKLQNIFPVSDGPKSWTVKQFFVPSIQRAAKKLSFHIIIVYYFICTSRSIFDSTTPIISKFSNSIWMSIAARRKKIFGTKREKFRKYLKRVANFGLDF